MLWALALAPVQSISASRGISVTAKTSNGRALELYSNSYALVIGVSVYKAGWPNLESVPGEMETIEKALEEQGFEITKVLDPTSDQLFDAFENFIDNYGYDKDNRLLFFFSGHGYTRKGGKKGYLVPADAPDPRYDEKGFLRKAIAMNNVLTWSRNIEAKHAIFVFDSCFAGTIFKTKGLPKIPPHISDITARPVRQFISAGTAGQEVPANSVFVPSFVRALRGAGDLDKDGYITGSELGMYLHRKVMSYETGQTPQYGKIKDPDLDEGDIVFVTASVGDPAPPQAVSPESLDLPEQGGASFDDILKASEDRRQAEEGWSAWQLTRNAEYAQVTQIDRDKYLTSKQKEQSWERFLSAVSQNNPYSEKDDEMRSHAISRRNFWSNKKASPPPDLKKQKYGHATAPAGVNPVELTYSVFLPSHHAQAKVATAWADEIKKRTNGSVKIAVFPGGSLTKGSEIYEGVVKGISDIGNSCFLFTKSRFPVMQTIDMPLGYTSGMAASKTANEFAQKYGAWDLKEVKLLYVHAHGPGLLHTRRPVHSLEDFRGMKIRSTGYAARVVNALKGTPLIMGQGGTYEALKTGAADGTISPMENLWSWKQGEVVKYTIECPALGYTTAMFVVMNEAKWNSLTSPQQKVFEEVSAEWVAEHGAMWDKADASGRAYALDLGNEMISLSREESARWVESSRRTLEEQAPKGANYIGILRGLIAKHSL